MYLLLLLGAKYGSSTCEKVYTVSSRHAVCNIRRRLNNRLGAPSLSLSSDIFTRWKCKKGRPVWVQDSLLSLVNRATAVIHQLAPASLSRRMDGYNQWLSFSTVVGGVFTSCFFGFTERPECFKLSGTDYLLYLHPVGLL